jgi:sterol O-acyltransferase
MATVPLLSNSVENVAPLVAQLSQDGTATLLGRTAGSYKSPGLVTEDSPSTISSAAEPIYEELEGLILDDAHDATMKAPRTGQHDSNDEATGKRSKKGNRPSVTIQLEKIDKAGHYKVHTEDNELRALLKQGFERSKDGEIKKKRSRFSDLVFTQQFTAFDRQNPASSTSIFHGFFSLFW